MVQGITGVREGYCETSKCWAGNFAFSFTELCPDSTVEPACSSSQAAMLVNSKDADLRSPTTYLCTWKSICFNHLHCTLLAPGVCLLAVGLENPIFPLLSPSGTGKPITHTATWRSISASPQAPWPGTRISWELMESTNQLAHTNSHTDRSDWLVVWQTWHPWDHFRPGAAQRYHQSWTQT